MRRASAACAAALALGCAAPTAPPAASSAKLVQISEGRPAMGTILEITVVASDEANARRAIAHCFAETERLEMIFTTWREDGELARLNARAGQGPQQASAELVRILRDAREPGVEGAFDVTVGPLVRMWREAGERRALPRDDEIAAARARVGRDRIHLDERAGTIALEAGTSADLGGIAKGWTLDRLIELLRAEGFERALLNFGGSSLASLGAPLDSASWRVSLGDAVLELPATSNVSISASFSQALEIGEERFSHIVDPQTGRALQRDVRVVAWAPNGTLAEVWSTALVVVSARHECTGGATRSVSMTSSGGTTTASIECVP